MEAFALLKADDHRIERQLGELIADYERMSIAQRFEQASLIFWEIKEHFKHQESVLASTSIDKVTDKGFTDECLEDRKDIVDAMDNLLNSHVDDPDFNQGLRKLLGRFHAHLRHFADKSFRQKLSPQQLSTINSQAVEWMQGSV